MADDVTLRWRGATDAVDAATTKYKIKADKTTPGTFADVVTQDSTSPFIPVSTTLNGQIDNSQTTIILASGTSFSTGDYVVVDREMIQLGTKSTNTFNGCVRGIGATVPQQHLTGVTVYKAHESYVDAAVNFGTRKIIRYQVSRLQSSIESVVCEVIVAKPDAPPSIDFCTVWGIYQDLTNDNQAGVTVTMSISGTQSFILATGELIKQADESTTTNTDGYWSFAVPKTIARSANGTISIVVGTGPTARTYTLTTVPDQDSVNIERIAT